MSKIAESNAALFRFSDRLVDGLVAMRTMHKYQPKVFARKLTLLVVLGMVCGAFLTLSAIRDPFGIEHHFAARDFNDQHHDLFLKMEAAAKDGATDVAPVSLELATLGVRMYRCVVTDQRPETACSTELITQAALQGSEARSREVRDLLVSNHFAVPAWAKHAGQDSARDVDPMAMAKGADDCSIHGVRISGNAHIDCINPVTLANPKN